MRDVDDEIEIFCQRNNSKTKDFGQTCLCPSVIMFSSASSSSFNEECINNTTSVILFIHNLISFFLLTLTNGIPIITCTFVKSKDKSDY